MAYTKRPSYCDKDSLAQGLEGNLWQSVPGFPTIVDVKAANISVSVCFNFSSVLCHLGMSEKREPQMRRCPARLVSVQAGRACS